MSSLKFNIQLSRKAEQDIADILRYTSFTWGKHQQRTYEQLIDKALNDVAENPKIGRYKSQHGAYFFNVGRHILAYTVRDDVVFIIRVLHYKMNPDIQLK